MNRILAFGKALATSPKSVGAVLPSSNALGKAIAQAVATLSDEKIVEIGPGTGALTKYLLHKEPTLIELDPHFYDILKARYNNLAIYNQCALDFMHNNQEKIGLVISIPMQTSPIKYSLIEAINLQISQKNITWCVIYTYGNKEPLPCTHFTRRYKFKKILLNIPPATVWIYKNDK